MTCSSDLSDLVKSPYKPYGCNSCRKFDGIFEVGGVHKVRCYPIGLRNIPLPGTCSGWMGEDLLEGWPERIGEEADVLKFRRRW